MKYLLALLINGSLMAMDFTPPTSDDMPAFMKQTIDSLKDDEKAQIDVRQHKRHSREHTIVDIHASITDADGKETKLDIQKDGTLTQSADSNETTRTYSRNFVLGSNCASVIVTGLIGTGVSLAIKYADCHK